MPKFARQIASFTEPYGTARDVVDIGAGTASALYNEATGDRENANAGWLQATTGFGAVRAPSVSGVAIRKGMDFYDYAKRIGDDAVHASKGGDVDAGPTTPSNNNSGI